LKEKARRQRSFNVVQHNDRVQKGAASPGTEFFRVNIIDSEGGKKTIYFINLHNQTFFKVLTKLILDAQGLNH